MISYATRKNWERLNSNSETDGKLCSRANKLLSTKNFVPFEYFSDIKNIGFVNDICNFIRENGISNEIAMNSLCVNLLIKSDLLYKDGSFFASAKSNVLYFIETIKSNINIELTECFLPDENDILGIIYQSIRLEGEKSKEGSYYTPSSIVEDLLLNLEIDEKTKILDPCCGTGSFLLSIENIKPNQIYGIDIDPIAVGIAKTNLFVKFSTEDFCPKIFCKDFLLLNTSLFDYLDELNIEFDYILSNPPWGAYDTKEYSKLFKEIKSNESFSFFIIKSYQMLSENGEIRFLLPESLMNVKTHADIRKFLLDSTNMYCIKLYGRCFHKVMSKAIGLQIKKGLKTERINIINQLTDHESLAKLFRNNTEYVFDLCNNNDNLIIDKIFSQKHVTLEKSIWGLGIVTGNNKEKVYDSPVDLSEHIYTGKEIQKYTLKPPVKHAVYNRESFQQVAGDEIYRAKEKLVYKFISKKLIFAYDDTQSLFLNSANILIPNIHGMSIKTVLAFLNSEVFQFVYSKKYGQIKILKNNLLQLPFPEISDKKNEEISYQVDELLKNKSFEDLKLQNVIYRVFGIKTEEKHLIKEALNGKAN